jgi:hypothetical protein
MAKTRKYNQRKSTRGKTPKKKNKMRQNKTKGGGERLSSCKNADNGNKCMQDIKVGDKIIPYNGTCKDEECVVALKDLKISARKTLNSIIGKKSAKTQMKQTTPRFKYVTSTGNSYNRRKTLSEIFGLSK